MTPPLPPPAPGVAVVQVRAPPSLQSPARRAQVAIYTGMSALELASVLQSVLELPAQTTCTGFLAVDAHSSSHHQHQRYRALKKSAGNNKKSKRHESSNGTYQRIVPLSLACLAPDLLATPSGYVTALVAHDRSTAAAAASPSRAHGAPLASATSSDDTSASAGPRKSKAVATTSVPPPAPANANTAPGLDAADAVERIRRFVAAMSDDHALTKFEAAVLLELCEQQPADVLRAMRSSSESIAQKQQFLLRLVRGTADSARANGAAPAHAPRLHVASSSAPAAVLASPSHAPDAQVAVVAAKVVAIARSVFSPQVQTEILDAAAAYRTKHSSASGGASAFAPSDASLSQKMELLGLIERLLRKHALPEEQVAYLVRLVLSENRLLLSALQSHRLDQSASDLEKAVQQIAALGPGPASSLPSSASKSPKKRASSPRKSARATVAPRLPQTLQGFVARPIDILHALHQKQLLTTLEYDLLAALVKQQDAQVLAAIDAFERSRDIATLRDALVFIVEDITTELGDDERAAQAIKSRRNGAANGAASGTAHWQAHLIALLHHWRDRDLLDAEYVPVLEALVAARHNLLQSAYEVFASDGDASELLDTLQRIAKLQRQAEDGAALEQFSRVVNTHCDVLRESEKALVKQLFVRRNELVRAAWDVYAVEQNVHDLGDTLLRIARFTTRADAKLRLVEVVGEMMRRNLVRSHEADGLIRLFEEKNDALLAAAEAFESDGDVNELVETLLLVVKHANFGDPPVCSPRHAAPRSRFRTVSTAPSLEFGESGADERAALQLIERLRTTGRLADWQGEVLVTLVGQHDDRVLAAMDVYSDDADVRELVDTLARLCDLLVWDEHAPSIVREWVAPLEERGAVPRGVLQQLIAARDDRVLAAFVVYLGDRNDDEFVDSLERIARIAARRDARSVTERVDCAVDLARADAQLAALVADGLLSSTDCSSVKALVRAAHAQVLAAFDVLDATDDRSDFVDTLARILARHSRSVEDGRPAPRASPTTSPIARMEKQLLHFASELGLAEAPLAALKRSIARQDEILTAAVEVYELEQDEDDLKDTLKRVALHIAEAERQ